MKKYIAVFFIFVLACVKGGEKGSEIKQKPESVDVSIDTLDSTVVSVSAIKTSVSAMKSVQEVKNTRQMVTGRIVTGRIVTARAPKYNMSLSPRIGKKQRSTSSRIGIKQAECTDQCCEYDSDEDSQIDQLKIISEEDGFVFIDTGDIGGPIFVTWCDYPVGTSGVCSIYQTSYAIGQGECVFPSCNDFQGSITDFVNSISSACGGLEEVGFELWGENYFRGCFRNDVGGDGTKDTIIIIDYSYDYSYGESGTVVIIRSDGKAEKYECFQGSCLIYASSCEVDEGCNYSCEEWVQTGYGYFDKESGGGCFLKDFDGDGKDDINILEIDQNNLRAVAAIIRPDLVSAVAFCTVSQLPQGGGDWRQYLECDIKVGSCDVNQCPQQGETESVINSKCQLKDYASCQGLEECEDLVYGFLSYEYSEDSQYGVTSCSRVINTNTGEFVSIKKVKDGYEYTKGTTESFFSTVCPQTSQVDFEICAITGCEESEQSAEIVFKLSDFVDEATKQVFNLSISDTKKGISGNIQIVYYKGLDEMSISGVLETKAGDLKIEGYVKYVKKDGSITLSFSLGDNVKGKFEIAANGSGQGEIEADGKIYTVKLNPDGSGQICDDTGECEQFSYINFENSVLSKNSKVK